LDLNETIWQVLHLSNTPNEGVQHIWPIITTKRRDVRQIYLNSLQGNLQSTKVSLPFQLGQSPSRIQQLCWKQLQCDIKLNISLGSAGITSQGWETTTWFEKWQQLEDGSHICHVLALYEIAKDNNVFFFDECKQKWTKDIMLKVLVNPNWDIPTESFFPLNMLTELWRINLSFPDEDLNLAAETPFPLKSLGEFDSSNKLLQKKCGIKASLELMQEELNIEHLSNN
jgi:hypothetical protein